MLRRKFLALCSLAPGMGWLASKVKAEPKKVWPDAPLAGLASRVVDIKGNSYAMYQKCVGICNMKAGTVVAQWSFNKEGHPEVFPCSSSPYGHSPVGVTEKDCKAGEMVSVLVRGSAVVKMVAQDQMFVVKSGPKWRESGYWVVKDGTLVVIRRETPWMVPDKPLSKHVKAGWTTSYTSSERADITNVRIFWQET